MGYYTYRRNIVNNVGKIEEVEYEINNEVSTEMTTKNGNISCLADSLLFIQPDVSSFMDQSNTSSKANRIPNT